MADKESDLLDLDSALAELGMLAQPSTLRLEYLQDRERGCSRYQPGQSRKASSSGQFLKHQVQLSSVREPREP